MEKMLAAKAKDKERNMGDRGKSESQMPGFGGNLFQSKVLMWYLLKGLSSKSFPFQLGTEIEEAGKFDDLVLKYEKNERNHFLIMQCKHRTGKNKLIKYEDILTDRNVDFGLVKNYNSFVESKSSKTFGDGEIQGAVIFTNGRFDMTGKIPETDQNWGRLENIGNIVEEIEEEQVSVLSLCKIEGGKYYKFKSDLVMPVLKPMILGHEFYKLAQILYKCLENDKHYLSLDDKILKRHCRLILTDVIDKKSKSFRDDFINERFEDVVNATEKQKLRGAFDKVLQDNESTIDKYVEKKFKWRKNFEKHAQTMESQALDVADADIKEFFEKCVFAIEQPDENKLESIISIEIRTKYPKYDTDLIYGHFETEIVKWMKSGNFHIKKSEKMSKSNFISSEAAIKFFEDTIRKFDEMVLKGPIFDYDFYIEKYSFDFVDLKFDTVIRDFIYSSDKRILSIFSDHVMITSIKLYMKLTKIIGLEELVYVKLSPLNNKLSNLALQAFDDESTNHWLVIEWDFDETKLDKWADKIDQIIDTMVSRDKKKLIIISNRDDIPKIYFSDMECEEIRDIKNTLMDIEKESHDRFLNSTVKFQGYDATLSDFIISEDLKKAIDGGVLSKILKREDVEIGKKIEGLKKDKQDYYIDRTFICKLENDKDVYLISGINEEDLCLESYDFKIIEKREPLTVIESNAFESAVNENESKNIYLLRKEREGFILLKESKDSFKMTDFLNTINYKRDKCEVNLISAVAGMGKSTLFSKLSKDMKDLSPKLWVVKFDLDAMSSKLNKMNEKDLSFETVVDFLHYGANHQDELEKWMFENRLQNNNIVLCMDGFDEICPNYKSIVLKIIKILLNEAKINKIWLSTRPYTSILNDMKSLFTNNCLKHYDIDPFTESDQKEYIKKFWTGNFIKVDKEYFEKFIEVLFELTKNNIKDQKYEFLGIALHTMLIGVAFKGTFEKYQNTNTPEITPQLKDELLDMLSLSSLYHQFVRHKCEILCKDKGSTDIDKIAGIQIVEKLYRECININKLLALNILLNEHNLVMLLTKEETKHLIGYKNEFDEKGDEFGIISQIADNKPHFIHQTFVEYFGAMFIVDNIKKKDEEAQEVVEYFLENMITHENAKFCQFIDSMLYDEIIVFNNKYSEVVTKIGGEKLHFVLENNWRNIAEILIENGIDLNYEYGGQTVFQLASKVTNLKGRRPILSLLVEKTKYNIL